LNGRLGKYELLDELGAGGMAVVYRAHDTLLQRTVALKVINQRLHSGESARKRFLNEARVAAALSHPNIISIYELGVEDGFPFIAMEYLPGRDLRDLLDERQTLEVRHKVNIALQIARALEHAHGRGVIHRDVKPANIRILESGIVKLMDFGIAKFLEEETSRLTRTGAVVGSTPYLSPEQLQGEEPSAASDAFAFGIVLYELLTYVRPFNAANPAATVYRILHVEAPPILDEQVPERLKSLVEACLRKPSATRLSSFPEIVRELLAIRSELAVAAGPAGVPAGVSYEPPAAETEPAPASNSTRRQPESRRSRTDSTALRLMHWARLGREETDERESPSRFVLISVLVFVLGGLSVVVLSMGILYLAGWLPRSGWSQRGASPSPRPAEASPVPLLLATRPAAAGLPSDPLPAPPSPTPSAAPTERRTATPTAASTATPTPKPPATATRRPSSTPTRPPTTTPTRKPSLTPSPTPRAEPPTRSSTPWPTRASEPTETPEPPAVTGRPLEQTKPRGRELEHYERAKSRMEKGEWIEAVENLLKAVEENPEPGYLLEGMFPVRYVPQLLLAEAYLNLGRPDLARRYLQEARRYRLEAKEVEELERRLAE
jgi:serine/threonine-protein kinase